MRGRLRRLKRENARDSQPSGSTVPHDKNHEFLYLKKHVDKLWADANDAKKRLHDLEIHADLMERLVVALALQKMGMRLSELRHLIRVVEKEAIADSEVVQLEQLFNMPAKKSKDINPARSKKPHFKKPLRKPKSS